MIIGKSALSNYLSGKIVFVIVAIVIVLIAFFIIRYIGNKKYENYDKELNDLINSTKSSPNLFFLNRVKNMISHDDELAERYEDLNKQYEAMQNFLKDEVEPQMITFDQATYYRKFNDSRKQYKVVKPLVDKLVSESSALENELSKIIEIDSKQKNATIELQQKYRDLLQNYESIQYKVDDMVPVLGTRINALESEFKTLNELQNDQNYKECEKLTESINSKVDFLAMNVRDLPTYISLTETIVPEQIEELEKRKEAMSELGFALENLNVSNRIYSIKELVKFIRVDIKELKIELVGENIEKLNTSIKDLNKDLDDENNAKGEYAESCNKIFSKVRKMNENYQYAIKNYKKLEERYIITDSKMEMESKQPVVERINDDLSEIKQVIATKNFSYKDVLKSLKDLEVRVDNFDGEITYFFNQRDEMKLKESRAKEQLVQINNLLLTVKSEIKNAHLPSINDEYKDMINQAYERAAEIQQIRSKLPIDLESLSSKTDEANNVIDSLYRNVHNLIQTAEMVEETIVYGNRYRSDIIEINNTLTQVEILFANGEYFDALSMGLEVVNKVDPDFVEKITNESNPTE